MSYMVDDIYDAKIDGRVYNIKLIQISSYDSLERWLELLGNEDYVIDTAINSKIVMRASGDDTDLCILKNCVGKRMDMRKGLEMNGYQVPKIIRLSYVRI